MFGLTTKKTADKRVLAATESQRQRISNLIKSQDISEGALRKRQGEKVAKIRKSYILVLDDMTNEIQVLKDEITSLRNTIAAYQAHAEGAD